MDAYTSFASVYDEFMDNIPYDDWVDYLEKLLKKYEVPTNLILDMGCGTGSVTRRLASKGYDMIGIDNSEEMLSIAIEKSTENDILYLLQDMRELELYGTVGGVVSICDSMNYITDEEELCDVFRLVNNYLEKDGVFIFDMNTLYKYSHILADNTIAESREKESFIWDNYYYEDEMINEYNLTIFVNEDEKDNLYRKYTETHYQKAYTLDTVKELLKKAGMEFVDAFDAFTFEPVKEDSERMYIIAREGYQKNKKYS